MTRIEVNVITGERKEVALTAEEIADVQARAAMENTPEKIQARLTDSVQRHLDTKANERGYDGILSAASYSTSTHPQFGPEGIAYRDWRDAVWAHCYQALADVQAGLRTVPTEAELIAELPALAL